MSAFAAGQAAAFKMFETIGRKPVIDAYDTKGRTLDDIHGDIELRDVYFSYPSRPDELMDSLFLSQVAQLQLWLDKAEVGSQQSLV